MFKNLIVYRLKAERPLDADRLHEALEPHQFAPGHATQPLSVGFVAPRGHEYGVLVEDCDGHLLLCLKFEERKVPAQALKRRVDEMAAAEEQSTGRKPGKKARKEMAEFAMQELLPQAFPKHSRVLVWIDAASSLLMIDASSASRAKEVVSLLVKSIEGLTVHLLQTAESPASCMAAWLMEGMGPLGFTIDRDCELKSGDEMKSVVKYGRHALDIEEVRMHLQSGKAPTKLALSWRDRVSFLLTDTLQIKRISFLDLVFEGKDKPAKDEAFDADAALATAELGLLIPALIDGLGGEHDFFAGRAAK